MEIKELTSEIRKYLNENVEEASTEERDIIAIIHTLISEENAAAASYLEKAKKLEELGKSDMAKVLLDISNEELVHASELEHLLLSNGLSNEEEKLKGVEEVDDMLKGEEI